MTPSLDCPKPREVPPNTQRHINNLCTMNHEMPPPGPSETEALLDELWGHASEEILGINADEENWRIQTLPLARIKKIMKTEEFIMQELDKDRLRAEGLPIEKDPTTGKEKSNIKFMISGEAPVVIARACELLIRELTCRAWQHTERNRRRTLQRQDIHAAVSESDVYDFLIDIVPRVTNAAPRANEAPPPPPPAEATAGMSHGGGIPGVPPQMDPNAAHMMGQSQLGGNEFVDQRHQQQFSNYLYQQMQHQQQQQQQQNQPPQGNALGIGEQAHLPPHPGQDMQFAG